jgi:sigma-B regulation protein RsbU (phosphoserine phosphatase)
MKAGVMVATTKSHFQTHALTGTHADILRHTSQGIQKLHLRGLYMCLALLTIKGRQATWTAAGIPALMHFRAATGNVEHHLVKGLPLGMPHHGTATSIEFSVEPDDVLLLLTDGLPELFDPQRTSLGYEPIEQTLVTNGSKDPQAIVEALLELADDWRAGQPYNDDVTLMVIKVTS